MADDLRDLIDRLLASGAVSKDTRAELGEFKQELAKGALDPGDRRYVESLGRRILRTGAPADDDTPVADEALDTEELWDAGDDEELETLRERAEAAEARVAELEAEVAELKARLGEAG